MPRQHPLTPRTQLRVDASVLEQNNLRNDLEDGENYTLALGLDHSFSPRFGGGFQLNGNRNQASDPGYSTTSGGLNGYLYRELGRTTAVVNFGYRHLEADERLFLYPERRKDNYGSVSLSGTFRALTFHTFAPLVRVGYERNWSSVEIYSFDRFYSEVGVLESDAAMAAVMRRASCTAMPSRPSSMARSSSVRSSAAVAGGATGMVRPSASMLV